MYEELDVDKGRCCLLADEAQGQGRPHERREGDDIVAQRQSMMDLWMPPLSPPPRRGLPPGSVAA